MNLTVRNIQSVRSDKELTKLIERDFGGRVSDLLRDLDHSLHNLLRTDLKTAGAFVEAVRENWSRLLPDEALPRVLSMEARYRHWIGDDQAAARLYRQALKLFNKQRDYAAAAALRRGLMEVYMYLGQYSKAIATGKRALTWYRRHEKSNDAAQVMTNIGNVYHRMDRNRMALQWYDKARDIFARDGGIPLAIVDYNRANIFANLNEFDTARQLYASSAQTYGSHGWDIARCQAEYSIGYLDFLQDRFADALRRLERVHDQFVELGDRRSAAVTNLDLAEIHLQLNQYGTAIATAEDARPEFKRLSMRYEEAKVIYFAGMGHLRLGDYTAATSRFRTADRLFSAEDNSLWRGMVALARADMYLERRQLKRATETAGRAAKLFAASHDARRGADAKLTRARADIAAGNRPAGVRRLKKLLGRPLLSYQLLGAEQALGDAAGADGRKNQALQHYRRAVEILEEMTGGMQSGDIRYFYLSDKTDVYRRLVDIQLEQGRVDESFLTSLRGLSLLNQPTAPAGKLKGKLADSLATERDRLRASLRKLYQHPRTNVRAQEQSTVLQTERRLRRVQRQLAQATAAADRSDVDAPSLDVLQQSLGHRESVLLYRVTGDSVGAFVCDRNNIDWLPLEATREDLTRITRRLHFVCEGTVWGRGDSQNAAEQYLAALSNMLLPPAITNRLGERVRLLADNIFAQIPFAALTVNGQPFIQSHELRLLSQPFVQTRSRKRHAINAGASAVFGVTSSRLPGITDEITGVQQSFPDSEIRSGDDASVGKLLSALRRPGGFVHIASHAARSSENPLFSRILLADGPLYPFDVMQSGVRCELVSLSACQTASPGIYYGNSFSLARAFHQAGARYVLASLWPASDTVSKQFMTAFYARLQETENIPDAYRQTVLAIAKDWPHPAFRASFILLGME